MPSRIWIGLLALAGVMLSNFAWAQDVPQSAMEVHPLLIGSSVPDAVLLTSDGEETTLHAVLGDSRAAVIFYRGGW